MWFILLPPVITDDSVLTNIIHVGYYNSVQFIADKTWHNTTKIQNKNKKNQDILVRRINIHVQISQLWRLSHQWYPDRTHIGRTVPLLKPPQSPHCYLGAVEHESVVRKDPSGWSPYETRTKSDALRLNTYPTNHNKISHTPWQCNGRDVCKTPPWSAEHTPQSTLNPDRNPNPIEIPSVGQAPGQHWVSPATSPTVHGAQTSK